MVRTYKDYYYMKQAVILRTQGFRRPKPGRSLQDRFPAIAAEWDYQKNEGVTPADIAANSEYAFYFTCVGHSYIVPVKYRTINQTGCNVCSGHVILAGVNDLKTKFPSIAEEMDRSDNGGVKSHQVGTATREYFNFTCDKGHTWPSSLYNRTSSKSGCPTCVNQRVQLGVNDLLSMYPRIAATFDVKKNEISPERVLATSNKVYWFICEKEKHSYSAVLYTVTVLGVQCGYCTNQKVLTGYNDLASFDADIASEFDVEKNGVTPDKVHKGSHESYWFRCKPAGHSWRTSIANRVNRGDGCSECAGVSSSQIEVAYKTLFAQSDGFASVTSENSSTLDLQWRSKRFMKVDIIGMLRSGRKAVIEYDGSYWHSREGALERDMDKTLTLLENGYVVVRIRENDLFLLPLSHPDLYQVNSPYSLKKEALADTVLKVERWLGAQTLGTQKDIRTTKTW